jgi:hypothetical protein
LTASMRFDREFHRQTERWRDDDPERDDRRAERRIVRWEHEHLLEAGQRRPGRKPRSDAPRREIVEHPFGTVKARMGAMHFLTKALPKAAAEMALSVLAYNLTRVMNIVGVRPLIAAIVA